MQNPRWRSKKVANGREATPAGWPNFALSKIFISNHTSELNKIKSTPNDEELATTNEELKVKVGPRRFSPT